MGRTVTERSGRAKEAPGLRLRAVHPTPRTVPLPSPSAPPGERDLLRAIAAGTAGVVGRAFLHSLTRHLALAFGADLAFVAERLAGDQAEVLASWSRPGIDFPVGARFPLEGTPCAETEQRDVVAYPTGVMQGFGQDVFALEHGLDGYLAVVMRGADGERLGYVAVMSSHRVEARADEVDTLKIFAARAAAEVERRRQESVLRERDAEIAASRVRIVQAGDEERRRIGRDLHDGAQQRLVALGHWLEVAQRRLPGRPDEAAELLAQAHEQARGASQELRELARGLHPAGLAERGLQPALAALAASSALPVELGDLPARRLPEPVEVTVYFLVAEALTNAVKYAGATGVRVDVRDGETLLVAEVSDDGRGGATPGDALGTGLRGLADRLEALGGTLEVSSPPGAGTRLRASIPLTPWRTPREPFLEFGYPGDGGLGGRLVEQVRTGEKTASISLLREWDLEGGPPRIGQRLPVRDGTGRTHFFVEIVRVTTVPFGEVDEQVIDAADSGVASLAEWRERQRDFYDGCREDIAVLLGEPGWRLTDGEPMVLLWYRVAA